MTNHPNRSNLNREQAELLAYLAKRFPSEPTPKLIFDVKALGAIGRGCRKAEERYANGDITDEILTQYENKMGAAAATLLKRYGLWVKIGGDPRGFCFYLFGDGLRGNTWGGDEHGFGLN